jgi:hypothetical protein
MFNKILNMQKLLLQHSIPPFGNRYSNTFSEQKYTASDKAFAIVLLTISLLYLLTVDQAMVFILMAAFSTLILGGFLSYNSDVISLIPVSKKFIFFNLHLSGFVLFILEYLIFILISYTFYGLILLAAFITTRGNVTPSPNNINNVLGLDASLMLFLIVAVFYCVLFTIMFIKNSKIRYVMGISFSAGYLVFLHIFKAKIASIANTIAANDMLNKFQLFSNKFETLKTYSIATAVIFILSLVISYGLYNRKNIKE